MQTTIRHAAIEDAQAIATIHVASSRAAYRGLMSDDCLDALDVSERERSWDEFIGTLGHSLLLAHRGDSILGFCHFMPSRDDDAAAAIGEITSIYLSPDEQGKGNGSLLTDAVLRLAKQEHFEEITLWVLTGNLGARSFYEKMGFRSDGKERTSSRKGSEIHQVRYRARLSPASEGR